MEARELGRFGEERAARYLRLHGYRIVETNYSCRLGEIDLIARKGRYLVFVEVKLRKSGDFAAAREFVTRGKQQRILSTASVYLAQNETELQPRFDVIEIYAPQGEKGKITINHIEDAFDASDIL
jgi:putative endonuclease